MIFSEFSIRTELAAAVVFPELIHYLALMDFTETITVEALYQQKGVKGTDFSIGRFQMKSSFVEDLGRQWIRTEWRHEYRICFGLFEILEAHCICVLWLDDRNQQHIYLAIFLKLLYRRFSELVGEEDIEQVRLCSTAYSALFYDTYERIRSKSVRCFYHTDFTPTPGTKRYAYSEIAVFYYKITPWRAGMIFISLPSNRSGAMQKQDTNGDRFWQIR